MEGTPAGLSAADVELRPPKSKLRDFGTALNGALPTVHIVRPSVKLFLKVLLAEGRGRAGKEGSRLWGPIPGEIVPGLCLSIPLNMESLKVGSLKL